LPGDQERVFGSEQGQRVKLSKCERAKGNAFLRHEAVKSPIFREGEGDCGVPSEEGTVFGLDRKHGPCRIIVGGSSDLNTVRW
jgi:hypothetical protein